MAAAGGAPFNPAITASANAFPPSKRGAGSGAANELPADMSFIDPAVHTPAVTDRIRTSMGIERYLAMRDAWRQPTKGAQAGTARRSRGQMPLDLDSVLDAIEDTPGAPMEPPVALPFMMEALQIFWDESDY